MGNNKQAWKVSATALGLEPTSPHSSCPFTTLQGSSNPKDTNVCKNIFNSQNSKEVIAFQNNINFSGNQETTFPLSFLAKHYIFHIGESGLFLPIFSVLGTCQHLTFLTFTNHPLVYVSPAYSWRSLLLHPCDCDRVGLGG